MVVGVAGGGGRLVVGGGGGGLLVLVLGLMPNCIVGSTFIIQTILTSQRHLSTAGGREGYLSIASTSGGYPFDSAEMTLLYFSLKIVPRPQRKTARDNFHTQFNATIFTHPHRSTCTVRHKVHSQERHSRCRCRSLSQELQLATQIHQMISSVTVCVWMHVQKTEIPSTPSLAKV